MRHAWRIVGDGGAVPVIVVGGVAGTFAARRVTPRATVLWLRRHDTPTSMARVAAGELRRLRTVRTLPAVLGFAIGVGSGPAYELAANTLGTRHGASTALLDAAVSYDIFAFAIVGYLFGVVVAEVTRRVPAPTAAVARLDPRRPDGYLTETARLLPVVFAIWTVAAVAAGTVVGHRGPTWPAIAAVLLTGGVALAQRYVIGRQQRLADVDAVALDDTLRSGAAHALAGGASALLLAWAVDATQWALAGDGVVPGGFGIVLGLASIVGYGLWMHYGSTHHGRRPGRVESSAS